MKNCAAGYRRCVSNRQTTLSGVRSARGGTPLICKTVNFAAEVKTDLRPIRCASATRIVMRCVRAGSLVTTQRGALCNRSNKTPCADKRSNFVDRSGAVATTAWTSCEPDAVTVAGSATLRGILNLGIGSRLIAVDRVWTCRADVGTIARRLATLADAIQTLVAGRSSRSRTSSANGWNPVGRVGRHPPSTQGLVCSAALKVDPTMTRGDNSVPMLARPFAAAPAAPVALKHRSD